MFSDEQHCRKMLWYVYDPINRLEWLAFMQKPQIYIFFSYWSHGQPFCRFGASWKPLWFRGGC